MATELSKISCKLKLASFPLHGGLNDESFPAELRNEARHLHKELSAIFKSRAYTGVEFLTSHPLDLKEIFKTILAGDRSINEYIELLKKFDSSGKCNAVWPVDCVAYRCSTCAFNSCMSLCADCFLNGDHEGHDFNRFFSLAGGACDCGNDDVLDPKGFCRRHDKNRPEVDPPPAELIALSEFVFTKLFVNLLNSLRKWDITYKEYTNARAQFQYGVSPLLAVSEQIYSKAEEIVSVIQYFVDQCSLIVEIMASILLNQQLYTALNGSNFQEEGIEDLSKTRSNFQKDVDSLRAVPFPETLHLHINGEILDSYGENEDDSIVCNCLLDELVFYLIRLAFPQTLINVLLCLLPNLKYKEWFSCKFFANYAYIAELATELMESVPAQSEEAVELSNRIIHMSVQICSSLNICKMLQNNIQVIDKIFNADVKIMFTDAKRLELDHSRDKFLNQKFVLDESEDSSVEKYYVTDNEGNKFVLRFGYSYLVTDMQNIFAHLELADTLVCNARLCEKYAQCISTMQGMNLLWRIVRGNHIEVEKTIISTRSFTLEWDSAATIMFNALASIQEMPKREGLSIVLRTFTKYLKRFFSVINLKNGYDEHHLQCPPFAVTFHLPLHRHLSYALWQGVSVEGEEDYGYASEIADFVKDEEFLRLCVQEPVRIHVVRAENYASMWVRNGATLRNSVSMYDRSAFTVGFQIPDLFLIRFCAANINQEYFINFLYYSFHLNDCFLYEIGAEVEFEALRKTVIASFIWIPFMIDGYLRLLLDLLAQNVNAGLSMENNLRAELVCVLSFGNFPHSKLKAAVPDRGIKFSKDYSQIFDKVLKEVADYQMPDQDDNIRHGQYKLKHSVWLNEFDPVLCRMRCISCKEFNSIMLKSEEKDLQHLKATKGANFVEEKQEHFWLGYRLFNFDTRDCFELVKPVWAILTQPTFFYTMHFVLKQWLISDQEQNLVLQEAVYLLNLAVKFIISENFEKIAGNCFYHINKLPKTGAQFTTETGETGTSHLLFTMFHAIEVRDAVDPRKAVLSFFMCHNEENRSILSLLLSHFEKCYETNKVKSSLYEIYYQLMHNYIFIEPTSLDRIFGSGKAYFGRLLCSLYQSDSESRKFLDELYEMHVLKNAEKQLESVILGSSGASSSCAANEATCSEKKLLAKRKQTALLQSQKMKHARLMQKMMGKEGLTQAEMDEMDTKSDSGNKQQHAVVYECPICNDQSTCTLNNLMGLMVHVQSNKILDGVTNKHEAQPTLMEIGSLRKISNELVVHRRTKSSHNRFRDSKLLEAYENEARFTRFSSGVNVRTCGHTAHLVCFKAYVDTLNISQHHPAYPTEHIYSCPVCRQPVNGILPLKPEIGFEKTRLQFEIGTEENLLKTVETIRNLILQKRLVPSSFQNEEEFNKQLYPYFSIFAEFEDMCRRYSTSSDRGDTILFSSHEDFALHGYRNKSQALLLGIVRSKIDYELLLKRKAIASTGTRNQKFDILKHLNYKARLSHDFFMDESVFDEFFKFVGNKTLFSDSNQLELNINEKKMVAPILLYDEKSVLCLFCSYILPDESLMDFDKFELCKFVYRLVLCMALCSVVLHVFLRLSKDAVYKLSSGTYFSTRANNDNQDGELAKICDFMCETISDRLNLFFTHSTPTNCFESENEEEQAAELMLSLCNKFCAELTRFFVILIDEHNLSNYFSPTSSKNSGTETSPSTSQNLDESLILSEIFDMNFVELYMLVTGRSSSSDSSATENLVSSIYFAKDSIIEWMNRLDQAIFLQPVDEVITHYVMDWHDPRILELPNSYDELFALFFGSICASCGLAPSSPMICLVCGDLCCLDRCCNVTVHISEIERHTSSCSFGCGCFLALHSSLIVIVRNSQSLIWGSVYLDAYGEEDRNLKRGKPLFLSSHRLQRLEEDWLRQSFVRKGSSSGFRNWLTIENLWQVLRDCHYYS